MKCQAMEEIPILQTGIHDRGRDVVIKVMGMCLKPKSKSKNQTCIFISEKNQKLCKSGSLSVQNLL